MHCRNQFEGAEFSVRLTADSRVTLSATPSPTRHRAYGDRQDTELRLNQARHPGETIYLENLWSI